MRDPEYDRFGPWAMEITEVDPDAPDDDLSFFFTNLLANQKMQTSNLRLLESQVDTPMGTYATHYDSKRTCTSSRLSGEPTTATWSPTSSRVYPCESRRCPPARDGQDEDIVGEMQVADGKAGQIRVVHFELSKLFFGIHAQQQGGGEG